MIALETLCGDQASRRCQIVLIFGLGLIGRSVLSELESGGIYSACWLPYSWVGGKTQASDGQRIVEYVSSLHRPVSGATTNRGPSRFDIVWSAGNGGFCSTEKQLNPELRSYENILILATRLLDLFPAATHSFHLISSAGGLFEGQRNVGPESQPHPRRPYGELKLRQEQLLDALTPKIRSFVYRPSSVYGFVNGEARSGLVTTMISNGILQKETRVFGGSFTLRDYLLASDVGRFVGRKVMGPTQRAGTFTLASGKPSSIVEILRMTELLLERNVYVVYQPDASNSADNTFRPESFPEDWRPTDLYTGMQLTKLRLLVYFSQLRSWRQV